MLTRQYCIRQARHVTPLTPTPRLHPLPPIRPLRFGLGARWLATPRSRASVGVADVVQVNDIPTVVPTKNPLQLQEPQMVRNLTKEYRQWLTDSFKVVEAVKGRLAGDRFDEAITLVRIASKDMQMTVGWNLLIDHLFTKQRLHSAIKLFNEMKKRNQLPNVKTYTTIFRGCAQSDHATLAVSEAVRIYMTMLTNPRIQPNIIHTNAVLEVCARAYDIESMMSVAETTDSADRKPDSITYATLFHGLRAWLAREEKQINKTEGEDLHTRQQYEKTVAKTVIQAKRIWQEVIREWTAGRIVIDEKLVVAMGRILAMGSVFDKLSVFQLLDQTMRIPNLEKKERLYSQRTAARKEKAALENQGKAKAEAEAEADPAAKTIEEADAEEEANRAEQSGNARGLQLKGVTTEKGVPEQGSQVTLRQVDRATGTSSGFQIVPTSKTMSLMFAALQGSRRTTTIQKYWKLFTIELGVVPDANNWHSLLLAYRQTHSSTYAAAAIEQMPAEHMHGKTFQYAFLSCVRDNVNPNVMQNANSIYERMNKVLPVPDVECIGLYLDTARISAHKYRLAKKRDGNKVNFVKLDNEYAMQRINALYRVWVVKGGILACMYEAKRKLETAVDHRRSTAGNRKEARMYMAGVVELARKSVAMYDKVLEGGAKVEELSYMRPRRDMMNGVGANIFKSGATQEVEEALAGDIKRYKAKHDLPRATAPEYKAGGAAAKAKAMAAAAAEAKINLDTEYTLLRTELGRIRAHLRTIPMHEAEGHSSEVLRFRLPSPKWQEIVGPRDGIQVRPGQREPRHRRDSETKPKQRKASPRERGWREAQRNKPGATQGKDHEGRAA